MTGILLSLGIAAALAVPSQQAFTQVPSRFETTDLTIGSRALGETCLSRDRMPDQTICNPALLGAENQGSLLGRGFVGNGYSALGTARQLLFEPLTRPVLEDLFRKSPVTSFEANTELVFSTRYFSAGFAPYRIQYLSEIHNPNFPVLKVHAALEQGFTVGVGAPFSKLGLGKRAADWSLGTKLRLLRRRFVHGSLSLAQALTEDAKSLLAPSTQNAFLADPALTWSPSSLSPAKPRFTIGARNLGRAWPESDAYPVKPDLQAGAGVAVGLGLGEARAGLDLVDLIHAEKPIDRARLGGSYQLGMLELMAGWNAKASTAGLEFSFKFFQAGISYELERSDLPGAPTSSRIATELAVRL